MVNVDFLPFFFFQSVFDADPQTLCNIALLQQGAVLVAQGIEIITRPSAGQLTEDFTGPDLTTITSKLGGGETAETQSLINTLEEATTMVRRLAQVSVRVLHLLNSSFIAGDKLLVELLSLEMYEYIAVIIKK